MGTTMSRDDRNPRLLGPTTKLARKPKKAVKKAVKKAAPRKTARRKTSKKRK